MGLQDKTTSNRGGSKTSKGKGKGDGSSLICEQTRKTIQAVLIRYCTKYEGAEDHARERSADLLAQVYETMHESTFKDFAIKTLEKNLLGRMTLPSNHLVPIMLAELEGANTS